MTEKIEILGVAINRVKMGQAKNMITDFIENGAGQRMVVTPNSEQIVLAQQDQEFLQILNSADLSVPDGIGVVLASKVLKRTLAERVAGFDLMQELLAFAAEKGYSVYLLGGRPGTVQLAREKIVTKYPALKISGCHHGYLAQEQVGRVLNQINQLTPDLLFIGMGFPRQEKFLKEHLDSLQVRVAMTVGGSFDVLADKVKRAPLWLQRLNLEWLFRLFQEPSRWIRMLALPRFLYLVLLQAVRVKAGGQRCV